MSVAVQSTVVLESAPDPATVAEGRFRNRACGTVVFEDLDPEGKRALRAWAARNGFVFGTLPQGSCVTRDPAIAADLLMQSFSLH